MPLDKYKANALRDVMISHHIDGEKKAARSRDMHRREVEKVGPWREGRDPLPKEYVSS